MGIAMELVDVLTERIKNEEQLKLLKIFHYVLAGFSALFSCVFLFHMFFGLAVLNHSTFFLTARNPPPPEFGWLIFGVGLIAFLTGWIYSACNWYAGRCIARRQKRLFVLVMAGINCSNMPLGIILGIFTFTVMLRASVTSLFTNFPSPHLTSSEIVNPQVELSTNPDGEDIWQELEKKCAEQAAERAKLALDNKAGSGEPSTISLVQPEHKAVSKEQEKLS